MGLRLLGMHHMRIGTGMGTGRLKGAASFYPQRGPANRDPYGGYFFRREVPSAPGALLVTWVELTVR